MCAAMRRAFQICCMQQQLVVGLEPDLVVLCAGLLTAYVSDTSLHNFVAANKQRQAAGQPKHLLLQTGGCLSSKP